MAKPLNATRMQDHDDDDVGKISGRIKFVRKQWKLFLLLFTNQDAQKKGMRNLMHATFYECVSIYSKSMFSWNHLKQDLTSRCKGFFSFQRNSRNNFHIENCLYISQEFVSAVILQSFSSNLQKKVSCRKIKFNIVYLQFYWTLKHSRSRSQVELIYHTY